MYFFILFLQVNGPLNVLSVQRHFLNKAIWRFTCAPIRGWSRTGARPVTSAFRRRTICAITFGHTLGRNLTGVPFATSPSHRSRTWTTTSARTLLRNSGRSSFHTMLQTPNSNSSIPHQDSYPHPHHHRLPSQYPSPHLWYRPYLLFLLLPPCPRPCVPKCWRFQPPGWCPWLRQHPSPHQCLHPPSHHCRTRLPIYNHHILMPNTKCPQDRISLPYLQSQCPLTGKMATAVVQLAACRHLCSRLFLQLQDGAPLWV